MPVEIRLALDTNVILAALQSWHEFHAPAFELLGQAQRQPSPPIIPLPALFESYAVMTRLPAPWRISTTVAHELLTRTFRGRSKLVALDGHESWDLLDSALNQEVGGGSTYDLHIAMCARRGDATHLATFNRRHFERFELGAMRLVVPGEAMELER